MRYSPSLYILILINRLIFLHFLLLITYSALCLTSHYQLCNNYIIFILSSLLRDYLS